MNYIINIGSNLGNRRLNISQAVRAIASRYGWFEMSHIMESEAWGYDSGNPFLNVCVMFVSPEEPEAVLDTLQDIERSLGGGEHRDATGGYKDRYLDIDIVAVDEEVIDTPRLKVPHPFLDRRKFFLTPMEEIAPSWRHPQTGLTCTQMLEKLELEQE